jgi:acetyltransferase-like isoleucine patch superfamily enzyme
VNRGLLRSSIEFASLVAAKAQAMRFGRSAVHIVARQHTYLAIRLDVEGTRNRLIVEPGVRLRGVRVTMRGDDNIIRLGHDVRMVAGDLWVEGNRCTVEVGDRTTFEPGAKLAAVEDDSTVSVGSDCLFSENVELRTSDSHEIHDTQGQRVNPPGDISIGRRVWVGNGVIVLKGVSVADDTVVGARSVVAASSSQVGVVLAGVPARVVREGVTWSR